jgi:Zn-dependent peptidase ImmA (M78 family)
VKLPLSIYSQLGPVPVVFVKGLLEAPSEEKAFGKWDEIKRQIEIDPSACDVAQLCTLFHELSHVALTDSGQVHNFTDQQQEVICDMIGTYLAAATLAGYIAFPRRR